MAKAIKFTKSGSKSKQGVDLPNDIFGLKDVSKQLIHQVYVAVKANARTNLSKTKTRSEVRGGGRKPWRQKGTGKARAGTIRSPLWRGGGITFGPLGIENYSKKVSRVARKTALKQALSIAADNNDIYVISSIELANGKTKELQSILDKLDLNGKGKIVAREDEKLLMAANNLRNVSVVSPLNLNVTDVLDSSWLLFDEPALKSLTERLAGGRENG